MNLDPTVNLGNVISAVVLLAGFVAAHIQNVRKIQAIESKVDIVFTWFIKHVINGHGKP